MSNKRKNREWQVHYHGGDIVLGTMKCTACQQQVMKGDFFRSAEDTYRHEFVGYIVQHHRCSIQWEGWKLYADRLNQELSEIATFLKDTEAYLTKHADWLEGHKIDGDARSELEDLVDEMRSRQDAIHARLWNLADDGRT